MQKQNTRRSSDSASAMSRRAHILDQGEIAAPPDLLLTIRRFYLHRAFEDDADLAAGAGCQSWVKPSGNSITIAPVTGSTSDLLAGSPGAPATVISASANRAMPSASTTREILIIPSQFAATEPHAKKLP
jgi:hypothetical protein